MIRGEDTYTHYVAGGGLTSTCQGCEYNMRGTLVGYTQGVRVRETQTDCLLAISDDGRSLTHKSTHELIGGRIKWLMAANHCYYNPMLASQDYNDDRL